MGAVKHTGPKHKRKNSKVKAPVTKTRKQLRKEKRQQKKIGRAMYYQEKNRNSKNSTKLDTEHNISEEESVKDANSVTRKNLKKKKKQNKLNKVKEKQRKLQLKEANEKEDKMIKQLEKRLKLNKRKSKTIPKSFVEDGLDYILDFCDGKDRSCILEAEKQMLQTELSEEFEEDLNIVMGKDDDDDDERDIIDEAESMDETEEMEQMEQMEDAEFQSDGSVSESDEEPSKKGNAFSVRPSETNDSQDEEAECTDDITGDTTSIHDSMSDEDGCWEDIYGRKRDKHGNVISNNNKYIPPAARATQSSAQIKENEQLSRLRKQLKGLINRLAEHNMHTIVNQVDELYMSNSRNDMNEMLSKLMLEALVTPVLTPDRLIAEHMMLIAILHANVGVEVGAHFLLTIVRKIDSALKTVQNVENKELDNLILLVSHLYNFKVYGHRLLYQILDLLAAKFTEKEIELILLILRTVGFPLRKDDPAALKELILNLQQKATSAKSENSRVKYLLDVMLAIKNNNMSKIPQYDPSHVEHLKKLMKNFVRKGNTVTQFNVSLEDLLHADERGKWWIVGSAWSGCTSLEKETKSTDNQAPMYSQKLLELARKQRMNTDIRRNIFCILMTAEDYLDAFEKLHHLGLKNQQEREVIYVMIDCCIQEKKFNPYYAVLAQKFCESDRRYQMTIQYTLWDKLKTLETYTSKQLANLAQFLTHLFIEKALPFSVLKVIEFAELDKHTMRLLRQIMLSILLHDTEETCIRVFERISLSPQLQNFRESLRLFVNHFLIKSIDSSILPEKDSVLLKSRVELVDKLLISRSNKMIF